VGRTWRIEDRAAVYQELRRNLAPVTDYAAERGITVCVEPLNRYETSLINTVDQCLDALDGLPGAALALDVYHMNIEETDLPAAIIRAGDRIGHVQVSANDRGAPGRDHLDWASILHALDLAGYPGPVVIESFTAHNATIATAASIWRPLAPTQDAIAVDGLTFLRSLTDA
jgi:D-psicose/D-tagatose/L-ribulose 3-epimerase